jgi:hypothetical protein
MVGMSDNGTDTSASWYFDTSTGEVTQGKKSGWDTRMGPYSSKAEAERALKTAHARTEAADEWDED